MKKLLATTALVVGIGFSAQASDPNDTLAQITEIVAAHYIEANETLQAEVDSIPNQIAEALDSAEAQRISYYNYLSYEYSDGSQVNNAGDLIDNLVDQWNRYTEENYNWYNETIATLEAELAESQVRLAEADEAWFEAYNEVQAELATTQNNADLLNEIATSLNDALINAETELTAAQADLEYVIAALDTAHVEIAIREEQIAELEAQIDEVWYAAEFFNHDYDTSNTLFQIVENAYESGKQVSEWTIERHVARLDANQVHIGAQNDEIDELEAQLAESNAATTAAQADAQEASNRANVNAQNATAWYEEAMRLQALLDEQ